MTCEKIIVNEQIGKYNKIVFLLSKVLLICVIFSPVFPMLLNLAFNKYSSECVSSYSSIPSDFFYVLLGFLGTIGLACFIIYVIIKLYSGEKTITIYGIFFIVFIAWILLCDIISKDTYTAFFGNRICREGFFTIVSYIGIIGISYICFNSKKSIMLIFRMFNVMSFAIAFFVLLQSFGIYIPFFEFGSPKTQFTGPFFQFNHYGYYLTIAIMVNIALINIEQNNKIKVLYFLSFSLHCYVLVLNNTFGCFLAVLFGIICFIVFNWIRNGRTSIIDFSLLFILFSMAFLVLLSPYPSIFADFLKLAKDAGDIASGKNADGAGTGRWILWKNSIKIIKNNPIFGIGSDTSTVTMLGGDSSRPHNEFIQYALFYGIPGLFLYLTLLAMILFPCIRNIKRISNSSFYCFLISLSYLASSLFGNTKYYIMPFFLTFLIGCLNNTEKKHEIIERECSNEDIVNQTIELGNN